MQLSFSLIIQQRTHSLLGSKQRWGGFVGDFSKKKGAALKILQTEKRNDVSRLSLYPTYVFSREQIPSFLSKGRWQTSPPN